MSHLHIPDGVLPFAIWGPGWAVALALLIATAWWNRGAPPAQVAYQGAIGALMLAAMAIELPVGPIDYHLTLVGPVGALLGPLAAYPVVFVVCAMLALVGHGGLTVIGLNALVLGAGAMLARPLARLCATRFGTAASLAIATASSQAVSGALWLAIVTVGLRAGARGRALGGNPGALGVFGALALPLWAIGVVAETVVAYGLGRFIARVRPDLLPGLAPKERAS